VFKIQLMYTKLKINVYFIFLNIGDLTFGITFVFSLLLSISDWILNYAVIMSQYQQRINIPNTERF
jgi:hypothetical protein